MFIGPAVSEIQYYKYYATLSTSVSLEGIRLLQFFSKFLGVVLCKRWWGGIFKISIAKDMANVT